MTTNLPIGAGSLGIDDHGTFRIRFDRTLGHPVAKVWAALTDPDRLSVWMQGCRIEPRTGGEVFFDFGEEGSASGRVVALRPVSDSDPSAELTHTWDWEGLPTSHVTWRLEPVAGGTRLLLTHAELPREPATDFAVGWHIILDVLDRYFGDQSWDDIWDSYGPLAEHYAAAGSTG